MLPRTHFGTFYDGEAYLVYSASLPGQPAGPDVIVNTLLYPSIFHILFGRAFTVIGYRSYGSQ